MLVELDQHQLSDGFDAPAMSRAIRALELQAVGPLSKGVSLDVPVSLGDLGKRRLNLLAGELPAPVAIIRRSSLDANAEWMTRVLRTFGLVLAPHAKTSMSPHLFAHQAIHGAWGLTVATVPQAMVAAAFGCRRILVANQVTGKVQLKTLVGLVDRTPGLVVYVCADSVNGLRALQADLSRQIGAGSMRVLLEVGFAGGRTGCRTIQQASDIFDECVQTGVRLAGISGYEGLIAGPSNMEDSAGVERYFDKLEAIAKLGNAKGALTKNDVIISAGGSSYFDVVGRRLMGIDLGVPITRVLRSGCYVTHDCGSYESHQCQLGEREPGLAKKLGRLQPALFVCGLVQSRPEAGLCLVTLGKRDVGHDLDFPRPVWWARPTDSSMPRQAGEEWRVCKLNDQHAYLQVPAECELQLGDLICFGISHPCTTFDRWRFIHVVDDNWISIGVVPTFF